MKGFLFAKGSLLTLYSGQVAIHDPYKNKSSYLKIRQRRFWFTEKQAYPWIHEAGF